MADPSSRGRSPQSTRDQPSGELAAAATPLANHSLVALIYTYM